MNIIIDKKFREYFDIPIDADVSKPSYNKNSIMILCALPLYYTGGIVRDKVGIEISYIHLKKYYRNKKLKRILK